LPNDGKKDSSADASPESDIGCSGGLRQRPRQHPFRASTRPPVPDSHANPGYSIHVRWRTRPVRSEKSPVNKRPKSGFVRRRSWTTCSAVRLC